VAGYTTAIAIAKALGETEIVATLKETLDEELAAGKKVVANSKLLLKEAREHDSEETEEEEDEELAETA
jgi:ferritin-like metal-binding protein YciE